MYCKTTAYFSWSAGISGILLFSGTLFLIAAENADAPPRKASVFKLVHKHAHERTYAGEVSYAKTADISFESKGRLTYVAPLGKYVQCEVLNMDGDITWKGDLLARQDTDIPQSDVKIAKVLLERADAVLKDKADNYMRDSALSRKNVVSRRQYDETTMLYTTALNDKEKASLDLVRAQQVLDACFIWTPFNAVVTEVYRSEGGSVDVGDPVLKISMIDPVKITITLPQEALAQFSGATRILVYPPGTKEPVIAWSEGPDLSVGKVVCYADNPLIEPDVVGPDGKRIAVVDALSGIRIIPEKLKIAPVWVVEEAVKKDRDGYFVWRIRDLKERYPENAIPEIMHLEKVRVVPQGLIMQYGNNFLRGLKTDAGLRRTDILVGDVPAGVNPGDRVVYHRKRHRFQIGEKVTAVFSGGYDDHVFLVPDRVLAKNGTDSGYHVFLRDGDRARAVPVAKLGKTEGKIRIYSTELKAGAELLMPSAGEKIGNGDRIAVVH